MSIASTSSPAAFGRSGPDPNARCPIWGGAGSKSVTNRALLLAALSGDYLYFAHSYACDDGPATLARADYGRPIPAVVRAKNWIAAQFHPERSGVAGARFLQQFLQY